MAAVSPEFTTLAQDPAGDAVSAREAVDAVPMSAASTSFEYFMVWLLKVVMGPLYRVSYSLQ
jgi:hypothetical protein